MSQGLISLTLKPETDHFSLDNWRLITLIYNDAKLLTFIFSQCLELCLHVVIDHCQFGFMKGIHIGDNINLVLDGIDYSGFLVTLNIRVQIFTISQYIAIIDDLFSMIIFYSYPLTMSFPSVGS